MNLIHAFICAITLVMEHCPTRFTSAILLITFLQRCALLLPPTGYDIDLYSDNPLDIMRTILRPFTIAHLLSEWASDGLITVGLALVSIINFVILSALATMVSIFAQKGFAACNSNQYFVIAAACFRNSLLYGGTIGFIPAISLLLISINCSETINELQGTNYCSSSEYYLLVIFNLVIIIILGLFRVFFFSSHKILYENQLKSKHSFISLLWPLLDFLIVLLQSIQIGKYTPLIFCNLFGLLRILDLWLDYPLTPSILTFELALAIIYQAMVMILSGLVLDLIPKNLVVISMMCICPLIVYAVQPIYRAKKLRLFESKRLEQRQTIFMVQYLLDLQHSEVVNGLFRSAPKNIILWYYALVSHQQTCKEVACQTRLKRLQTSSRQKLHLISYTVVECILSQRITELRLQARRPYEMLTLCQIAFFNDQCDESLRAFCLLKTYQQTTQQHTLHFKCINETLSETLKQSVLVHQLKMQRRGHIDGQEKQLSTSRIKEYEDLVEEALPRMIKVLSMKVDYWMQMVQGYPSIQDFGDRTVKLSSASRGVQTLLEQRLGLELTNQFKRKQHENLLVLRLLSVYFAFVMNDYEFVRILCIIQCYISEGLIEEILRADRSLSADLVLNSSLLSQEVIIISVSTMRNPGHIISKNRGQISTFFCEHKGDSENPSIDRLMPLYMLHRHKELMARFLETGSSDLFLEQRLTFVHDGEGYVFPVLKKLQNFFEVSDDYIISAQINRVRRNNEYLLFDRNGRVLGMSRNLFKVVAADDSNLQLEHLMAMHIAILVPNIVDIVQSRMIELNTNSNENHDDKAQFVTYRDPLEAIEHFQTCFRHEQIQNKVAFSNSVNNRSLSRGENSRMSELDATYQTMGAGGEIIQGCQIPLLSNEHINPITQFQQNYQKEATQHTIEFNLGFKVLHTRDKFSFFYIEILDVRKRLPSDQIVSGKQIDTSYNTTFFSPSEVTPMNTKTGETPPKQLFLSMRQDVTKAQMLEISDRDDHLVDMESARFMLIMPPFSQRPNFIQPKSYRSSGMPNNDDFQDIESDFRKLQEGQNVSLSYDQSRVRQLALIRESEEEAPQNDVSSKKEHASHQIKQILSKFQDQHADPEAIKSSSTRTSLSAKREALALIKGLRSKTTFNRDLRAISLIYMFMLAGLVVAMAVWAYEVRQNNAELKAQMDDVVIPQFYMEEYYLVLASVWLTTLHSYELLDLSKYTLQRLTEQRLMIKDVYISTLMGTYNKYRSIEAQGLIGLVNISYVDQPILVDQIFDKLMFLTQQKFASVVEPQEISLGYLHDIMFLQRNLVFQINMNIDLVDVIGGLFDRQEASAHNEYLLMLLVELSLMMVIVFAPLAFWFSLLRAQQLILLFNSRLSEATAKSMMVRCIICREILSNANQWRLQNYFDVMYEYTNEVLLQRFQIDLKVSRAMVQQEQRAVVPTQARRNQILSSRIKKINFSPLYPVTVTVLVYVLIVLYLCGGYALITNKEDMLQPSQDAIINIVKFRMHYDAFMMTAILAKSNHLLVPEIIDQSVIDAETIRENLQLQKSDEIISTLWKMFEYAESNHQVIWKDILKDGVFTPEQRRELSLISENSLCDVPDLAPYMDFCGSNDLQDRDNNLLMIKGGLTSLLSRTFQNTRQSYSVELLNGTYDTVANIQAYISTNEFTLTFIGEFLTYYHAFDLFQKLFVDSSIATLDVNETEILAYYLVAGTTLTLLLVVTLFLWLHQRNRYIHFLRMGIINIPIEMLLEPQMMLMLKRLGDK